MKIEMNDEAAAAFVIVAIIALVGLIVVCIAIGKSREHQQRIELAK